MWGGGSLKAGETIGNTETRDVRGSRVRNTETPQSGFGFALVQKQSRSERAGGLVLVG